MEINFYAVLVAALSSLVTGMIWYNPKVFGNAWMREIKFTPDPNVKPNMIKMFGLTFVYSFFVAFFIQMMVIHQFGAIGMVGGDPTKALPSFTAFMADYGTAFRTFKHGALHGTMVGLFFITPIMGVGALYENRSFKYVLITGGYWVLTCAVMGAIVCGWV
ncbi:DUF1761 domain-containing protein [Flavobacterium silvaticum]|uniref:DUF1761 domain-containing protein n=1 Tax=Flavobacterium silvaticum TaxID=1852020 RepID=A0A972FKD4_9FLAO|nr:DUF1761 domain-containing protein [Flavobacterium silvaticum]NMH27586.1 DUF1761 domain-containing protein [Flavobacterium silvaticum]